MKAPNFGECGAFRVGLRQGIAILTEVFMADAPTIAERYSRATHSSNLRSEAHKRGDIDLLVAAGWSDPLGMSLQRLRSEYDQAAADIRRMGDLTGAILVLGRLKTLATTRVQITHFALDAAKRWRAHLEPQIVGVLAGHCLSAFLERNCLRCHGTGHMGGYDGTAPGICRTCKGSGKAKDSIGNTDAQKDFASRLLSTMDMGVSAADGNMAKVLR